MEDEILAAAQAGNAEATTMAKQHELKAPRALPKKAAKRPARGKTPKTLVTGSRRKAAARPASKKAPKKPTPAGARGRSK